MRKKILSVVVMTAIAVAACWNISQSRNNVDLSNLGLTNADALARGESGGIDQSGKKLENNCCVTNVEREFKCSDVWPDCQ